MLKRTVCIFALAAAAAFAADRPARQSPPFIIQTSNGELPLAKFQGKIVVLAFIYTTCPHCQDLTQLMNPIAREYAPKGVQFLECAFNQDAAKLVPGFAMQYKPPFPVGWADDAAVRIYLGYAFVDTRPMYVPHLVFLDRQGKIRGDYPGESPFLKNPLVNIRAELDKLLQPAPATTAKKK